MKKVSAIFSVILFSSLFLCSCSIFSDNPLGAGFRYSSYGPPYNPGPEYWADAAQGMAKKLPGAVPQGIWIIGQVSGKGTFVNFPTGIDSKYVMDSAVDGNEEIFDYFDDTGVQIWLQIEPGLAPVEDLIHALLKQYGHHPCVIGVGIDVEWYQSYDVPEGKPVTDEEARTWVAAARSYNKNYRVFLKHWEIDWMPPSERDGLVFIDDSQGFSNLDEMVAEFQTWGKSFAPAPVGFQYGYYSDKVWWENLHDPAGDIGEILIEAVPNASGLYWVDFTIFDIFPPQ